MQRLLFTSLAALLLTGCMSSPTQFALIGDNPYDDSAFPKYERLIADINATPGIDWVIHLGDLKGGSAGCSDDELEALYELNAGFAMPFVLTPGDNDWFDCRREAAGGWKRLERLDKLREIFYGVPPDLPVTSQRESERFSDFVENVYWQDSGVMFAAIHLVGISGEEGGLALHDDVQDAAIEWLQVVFQVAAEQQAKGVFLAIQADIYPFTGLRDWLLYECPHCPIVRPHYERFHAALLEASLAFTNPIVLAVGDTHVFRVDKPLYDGNELVDHFARVEGFGADQVHWVKVVVRPETRHVFEFHQQLVPGNIGTGWSELDKDKKEN